MELEDFVESLDEIGYFDNMTFTDLKMRKCQSKQEYRYKYLSSIRPFDIAQSIYLSKLCKIADILCRGTEYKRIPWHFVKVGSDIELGYPHTVGKYIVLNDTIFAYTIEEQIEMLIHEKIHIWQRMNRDVFDDYFIGLGYIKISNKKDTFTAQNPDAMGTWMFKGDLADTKYTGKTVIVWGQEFPILKNDHPYELFAYQESERLVRRIKDMN